MFPINIPLAVTTCMNRAAMLERRAAKRGNKHAQWDAEHAKEALSLAEDLEAFKIVSQAQVAEVIKRHPYLREYTQ